MPQLVSFGPNNEGYLKSLFRSHRWKKCFMITGKRSFIKSGAKDFIDHVFKELDISMVRFSEFENNPNISDLEVGLNKVREFNPDVILAIGGGSVIDMGKLIRFFYTHVGDPFDKIYLSTHENTPLIAIPTTAGTGSEATHFAVLYDGNKRKHSIASPEVCPEYAIIHPKFTYVQNPYLTACVGFDALSQAIEAYWNKKSTSESDEYALKAIELIFDTLPETVKHPTDILRNKLSEGAYWAGRAINITKTTAPHAFSYPFTSYYGIPHGHAVAIVFPKLAIYNLMNGTIPSYKINYIKNLFGGLLIEEGDIESYINNIGLNIPSKDYDINLLLEGINMERLANNPATINFQTSKIILASILS